MKLLAKLLLFLITFTLLSSLEVRSSLAWEGFDQENNTEIEIPSGNLVREGLVIEFYINDNLHLGKVITVDTIASGTEVVVEDLNDDNKERVFIMR